MKRVPLKSSIYYCERIIFFSYMYITITFISNNIINAHRMTHVSKYIDHSMDINDIIVLSGLLYYCIIRILT